MLMVAARFVVSDLRVDPGQPLPDPRELWEMFGVCFLGMLRTGKSADDHLI